MNLSVRTQFINATTTDFVPESVAAEAKTGGVLHRNRVERSDLTPRVGRGDAANVWVARTVHATRDRRFDRISSPPDRYVLLLALQDSEISFGDQRRPTFAGPMAAGTLIITGPGADLAATSNGPCDVLHLSVLRSFLDQQLALSGLGPPSRRPDLKSLVVRDFLIEQIGRVLVDGSSGWPRGYVEILGQLVVARLARLLPRRAPKAALPAWRLKRVHTFVESHIADPLRLQDLAAAAGLSRMHFAAQFRAATGFRPHSYVLHRRIEQAKQQIGHGETTLVQVALDVGFQSQAHFCTIFKRLTGVTPTCWRRQTALGTPQDAPLRHAAA